MDLWLHATIISDKLWHESCNIKGKMMTKRQAIKLWVREHKPAVIKREAGNKDIPLRYESWRMFCEGLAADGEITEHQRHTWHMPREVER
jgi:hypothetical protein